MKEQLHVQNSVTTQCAAIKEAGEYFLQCTLQKNPKTKDSSHANKHDIVNLGKMQKLKG